MSKNIADGVVHKTPKDLKEILSNDEKFLLLWNNLTPLARNEWICWIEYPKKLETRNKHLKRAHEEIKSGKKRPCCWPGCDHR